MPHSQPCSAFTAPKYRLHRPSGQAVVRVRRPHGLLRDIYLGQHGSPESKAEYARVVAELAAGAAAPRPAGPAAGSDTTVNKLLLAFLTYPRGYYVGPDGTPTSEYAEVVPAGRPLEGLYGHTRAVEFGPLALKAVRQKFADAGLSRGEVNRRTRLVRQVFKWGAAEELVPAAVYLSLAAVEGLRKGRCGLPEPEPVRPVADADVRVVARRAA